MSPETKHNLTILLLKMGITSLLPKANYLDTVILGNNLNLKNPIGLAAGFDKNGDVIEPLFKMGFGFIEIGTVTPKPQKGNDKPRLFKYDDTIVNSMGFNNKGFTHAFYNLENFRMDGFVNEIVGVNIGCNYDSDNRTDDYVRGFELFETYASYITINISSPNTENLRDFHKVNNLNNLIDKLTNKKEQLNSNTPIYIKLSPDEKIDTYFDICDLLEKYNINGIIIGNTTINNTIRKRNNITENGGISGSPLKKLSFKKLKEIRFVLNSISSNMKIISVGGIENSDEIENRLVYGANAIQLYSALTYNNPLYINKILKEMKGKL